MTWQIPPPRDVLQMGIAEDWRTWDNLEPIILERRRVGYEPTGADPRRNLDAGDVISVPAAKRRALSVREKSASQGAYQAFGIVWHIPAQFVPDGVEITPGWVVIDGAGNRFTVMPEGSSFNRLKQTWKLNCVNLIIAYDLSDTINIERATHVHDEAGFPRQTFSLLYRDLRARVQPKRREYQFERGIEGFSEHFDVTIEREISVKHHDRIIWLDLILDVSGYQNSERLDELPVIEATKRV